MFRRLIPGGGALVLALALLAPLAHGGDATAMGQVAGKHVLLSGTYDPVLANLKFYRVYYYATVDPKTFKVPAKEVLVVTDFTWTYAGTAADAGRTAVLSLSIYNPKKNIYAETFLSSTTLDANGWGCKSESQVSGMLVGGDIEIRLTPPSPILTSDIPQTVLLRGYLVPKK